MDFIVKRFSELSVEELYEILKTRFEIFVTEQECIYQDLDDKDKDALHVFCLNESGRVAGCLRVFWRDEKNGVAGSSATPSLPCRGIDYFVPKMRSPASPRPGTM